MAKPLKTDFLFSIHETLFKKMEKALANAVEMAAKAIEKGKEKKKIEKNKLILIIFFNFNGQNNSREFFKRD